MKTIVTVMEAIEQHDPAVEDFTIFERASVYNIDNEEWQLLRLYKDSVNEIINSLSREEKHMFLSWVLMSEGRF